MEGTNKRLQPYKHNCRTCQWVGWFTIDQRIPPANVYICGKTVVIRFSDEPGDYWSSLEGQEPSALSFFNEELAENTLKLVAERKAQYI